MTSPVLQALMGARLQEEPSAFGKWCIVRGVRSLPAMPAHVASFITELAASEKSIKQIWPIVKEISAVHVSSGFADPTAGGVVADMINSITMIDPPRSWPKDEWPMFKALPYDLQVWLRKREAQRDSEVRRTQNDAALWRKHIEKAEANNGTIEERPEIAAA